MSKGPKAPKSDRPVISSRDPQPSGSTDEVQKKCWQFILKDKTVLVEDLKDGIPITGSIHGRRVLVSYRGEALGFAPESVAKEIVDSVRITKKRLRGQVLSNSNSITLVELCLIN